MKKIISLMILLSICISVNSSIVYGLTSEEDGDSLYIENAYIRTITNKDNGRFAIKTVDGSPFREDDVEKKLLFMELTPETSYTTFRIDGTDYIYGNEYNYHDLTSEFIVVPKYYGNTSYSKWRIGDIYISQYLILENEGENAGDIRVKYEVENTGEKVDIGARILLDTMIGENDGSSVLIPNLSEPITFEEEFEGDEVPTFWYSPENVNDINIIAKGTLETGRYNEVDRFVVGHWEGLSRSKYDYEVDDTLDFTSDDNVYESADSAVGIYFDEEEVANNTTTVYQTIYGIGNVEDEAVKNDDDEIEYTYGVSPSVDDLEVLSVDGEDSYSYSPNPLEIIYYIDNTYEKSSTLENISFDMTNAVELYDDIFQLVEGEEVIKTIEKVEVGEIAQVTYNVEVLAQDEYVVFEPYVSLSVNEELIDRIITSIEVPELEGMQETSFLEITPEEIYIGDDEKTLTISGEGFYYIDSDTLTVKLIDEADTETELLPQINSDREISAGVPTDISLGTYTIEILVNEEVVKTFESGLEITDDETLASLVFDELEVNEDFIIKGSLTKTGEGDNEIYTTEDGVTYLINDYIKFEGDMTITDSADFYDADSDEDGLTKIEGNGEFYIDQDISSRVPTVTFYDGDFKLGYFEVEDVLDEQEITIEQFGLKVMDSYSADVFRNIGLDWELEIDTILFNSEGEDDDLSQDVEMTGGLEVDILGVDLSDLADGLDAMDFAKVEDVTLDTEGVYYSGEINVANPYADYGIGPFQTAALTMYIDTGGTGDGDDPTWGMSTTAPMPIPVESKNYSLDSVTLEFEFVNQDTLNSIGITAEGSIKLGSLPAEITAVSGSIDNIEDTEEMPTEVEIGAVLNDTVSPEIAGNTAVTTETTFTLSDSYFKGEGITYCYIIPTDSETVAVVWDADNCKNYSHNGLIVVEEMRLGYILETNTYFYVNTDELDAASTLNGEFTGTLSVPEEIPGLDLLGIDAEDLAIDLAEAHYYEGEIYTSVDIEGLVGVTATVDLTEGTIEFDTSPAFFGEFIIDAAEEVYDTAGDVVDVTIEIAEGVQYIYADGIIEIIDYAGYTEDEILDMAEAIYGEVEIGEWVDDGMEVLSDGFDEVKSWFGW